METPTKNTKEVVVLKDMTDENVTLSIGPFRAGPEPTPERFVLSLDDNGEFNGITLTSESWAQMKKRVDAFIESKKQ